MSHQGGSSAADPTEQATSQTEYAALSSYFNTLIGFRLTLLGFYLAAIGLIASAGWPTPVPVAALAILVTVSLYIFELRTRILFHHLAKRGIQIELSDWKREARADALPFFSRQFPEYLVPYKVKSEEDYYATRIKILGILPMRWRLISHSFSLDLLYLSVLLFFVASIVVSMRQ